MSIYRMKEEMAHITEAEFVLETSKKIANAIFDTICEDKTLKGYTLQNHKVIIGKALKIAAISFDLERE